MTRQAMAAAVIAFTVLALGVLAGLRWAGDADVIEAGSRPAPAASDAAGTAPTRAVETIRPASAGGMQGRTSATAASPSDGGRSLAARYARDLGPLAGRSGVAIVPLGGGNVVLLGDERSGVAWSTIKVPIAIAARQHQGWDATREQARPAITVSDNEAARALWASLGAGRTAAGRIEAVLAAAGDSRTTVQPNVTRSGFTPFGQTQWSLESQAQGMAGMACEASATEVLALMREVVSSQRWGLGRWDKAPIKGGWGPLESGKGYLVRQMGVVPLSGGQAAVALIAKAPEGFASGVADMNRMAVWLAGHAAELPSGRC